MRKDSLPSPGQLSMGMRLHTDMAKAISAIEISAAAGAGKSSLAKNFDSFLTAAKTAIAGFIDAVAPTITSRTIAGSFPSVLRIRLNKDIDRGYVPPASAFAVLVATVARTVTNVAIDGPDLVLTLASPVTTGQAVTVAYTQPGAATNVRDLSGNLLANSAATAVTNGV